MSSPWHHGFSFKYAQIVHGSLLAVSLVRRTFFRFVKKIKIQVRFIERSPTPNRGGKREKNLPVYSTTELIRNSGRSKVGDAKMPRRPFFSLVLNIFCKLSRVYKNVT